MEFENLISKMTQSIVQGNGIEASECFAFDGAYHDVFYGLFPTADIPEMVENYFHRDATNFVWDLFDPVSDGNIGYVRYVFSYDSLLLGCEGKRAIFEGIARCELKEGLLLSYREVADAFTGLTQLGFSGERLRKIGEKQASSLLSRREVLSHLKGR